jgi:hypothetical protein
MTDKQKELFGRVLLVAADVAVARVHAWTQMYVDRHGRVPDGVPYRVVNSDTPLEAFFLEPFKKF